MTLISLLSRITSRTVKVRNILNFLVEAEIFMFPRSVNVRKGPKS